MKSLFSSIIMGKIQLQTFVIAFDRPQPVYRPGEVISGNCVIQLNGELNLSQLEIKLHGCAEVKWTETERHNTHGNHRIGDHRHNDNHSHVVTYHATHPCIELKYYPGSVYQTMITSGQHNIGFSFQLPVGVLPSSYEGSHGHIRYYIEAKIHKPELLSFDHKTSSPITIQSPAFAPIQELSPPVTNRNSKTIGFFGSGTVSLLCSLANMGQNIGTTIPITCSIDNQSKKAMTLRATLKQEVDFHASAHHKKCSDKLVRAVGSTIAAFSKTNEIISLLIPNTIPVVYNSCPIINIKYVITITLDIPGSFDLHCDLPVILTNQLMPFNYS